MRRREVMEAGVGAGLVAIAAATFAKPEAFAERAGMKALPMDPGTGLDAELVADCAAFDALERQVHAIHGVDPEHEAERDRLSDLEEPIVERIVETRAHTVEGHAARARSLIEWEPRVVADGPGYTDDRLLHALLRDLAGDAFVAERLAAMRAENVEAGT